MARLGAASGTVAASVLMVCTVTVNAAPDIDIGSHFDYVEADQSNVLKRIANHGDSTAFVEVSVQEILFDPASGTSAEVDAAAVEVEQDGVDQTRATVVASPQRLIIPSLGVQTTRLLYMGPRDRERYFRVRFNPVPASDTWGVTDIAPQPAAPTTVGADVMMLVGYGGVLTVRPGQPVFDTKMTEVQGGHRIQNDGNSSIILDTLYDCAVGDPDDCLPPTTHRVRPGRKFEVTGPGRMFVFDLVEGTRRREVVLGKEAT